MRTEVTLILAVLISGVLGGLIGYQAHEPDVIIKTETKVEKVKVPKVVTETKVEKVKVPKVVEDRMYVSDGLGEKINKADQYLVVCGGVPNQKYGVVMDVTDSDATSIKYDTKTDSVVYTVNTNVYLGKNQNIPKSKFNRMVENKCGLSPDENKDMINEIYGGGEE